MESQRSEIDTEDEQEVVTRLQIAVNDGIDRTRNALVLWYNNITPISPRDVIQDSGCSTFAALIIWSFLIFLPICVAFLDTFFTQSSNNELIAASVQGLFDICGFAEINNYFYIESKFFCGLFVITMLFRAVYLGLILFVKIKIIIFERQIAIETAATAIQNNNNNHNNNNTNIATATTTMPLTRWATMLIYIMFVISILTMISITICMIWSVTLNDSLNKISNNAIDHNGSFDLIWNNWIVVLLFIDFIIMFTYFNYMITNHNIFNCAFDSNCGTFKTCIVCSWGIFFFIVFIVSMNQIADIDHNKETFNEDFGNGVVIGGTTFGKGINFVGMSMQYYNFDNLQTNYNNNSDEFEILRLINRKNKCGFFTKNTKNEFAIVYRNKRFENLFKNSGIFSLLNEINNYNNINTNITNGSLSNNTNNNNNGTIVTNSIRKEVEFEFEYFQSDLFCQYNTEYTSQIECSLINVHNKVTVLDKIIVEKGKCETTKYSLLWIIDNYYNNTMQYGTNLVKQYNLNNTYFDVNLTVCYGKMIGNV